MKRAGRGDGSRRPKIFGVAGKGDSIRSRGDSARYHHQEKAGIFGDFVRAPECGQKKRAGTCVPAQPFRLSPPETVDAMNATFMSPWKGLNWRRRASILCRRFCAQNAQQEAGTSSEEHTSELQSLMRISYAV